MPIQNYGDFLAALREAGFSMGGGNAKGIFSLLEACGEGTEPENSPIRWHSEEPERDPWEWRMRVLEEEKDIAYGKLFFGTSGYITKEWYPYFLAVRRQGQSLEECYESGTISHQAKLIYDAICRNGMLAMHEIRQACGFTRADSSKFQRAMTELQMRLFISMCGRKQKQDKYGMGYGWNSTSFCTVEAFWEARDEIMPEMEPEIAFEKLRLQVLKLNPAAKEKDLRRFILG